MVFAAGSRRTAPRRFAAALMPLAHALALAGAAGHAGEAGARAPAAAGEPGKAIAVILAPRRHAVLSAGAAGKIQVVARELGEEFEQGEILVEIDPRLHAAHLGQAEAVLKHALARLAQAEELARSRNAERRCGAILAAARAELVSIRTLHRQKQASDAELARAERDAIVAETDLEAARSAIESELAQARRDVAIAEAERDLAARRVADCAVAAPFPGRVVRVLAQPYEQVEAGAPLVEIADDRMLLARFLVPTRALALARKGKRLSIRIADNGSMVEAVISHVSSVMESASMTCEIQAEIDNRDDLLRPGMNGSLLLEETGGE